MQLANVESCVVVVVAVVSFAFSVVVVVVVFVVVVIIYCYDNVECAVVRLTPYSQLQVNPNPLGGCFPPPRGFKSHQLCPETPADFY